MWNTIYVSRILDRKAKQFSYSKHIQALCDSKSRIKINFPVYYEFLSTKSKAKMLKTQNKKRIDNDNILLVSKINHIYSCARRNYNQTRYRKNPLADLSHRNKIRKIKADDQILRRKIIKAQSPYSLHKLNKSINWYEKNKANLVNEHIENSYSRMNMFNKGTESQIQRKSIFTQGKRKLKVNL